MNNTLIDAHRIRHLTKKNHSMRNPAHHIKRGGKYLVYLYIVTQQNALRRVHRGKNLNRKADRQFLSMLKQRQRERRASRNDTAIKNITLFAISTIGTREPRTQTKVQWKGQKVEQLQMYKIAYNHQDTFRIEIKNLRCTSLL